MSGEGRFQSQKIQQQPTFRDFLAEFLLSSDPLLRYFQYLISPIPGDDGHSILISHDCVSRIHDYPRASDREVDPPRRFLESTTRRGRCREDWKIHPLTIVRITSGAVYDDSGDLVGLR